MFQPGPGNHSAIVRAQRQRRGGERHPFFMRQCFQSAAQRHIGGNASCYHQRPATRVRIVKHINRVGTAVDQHIAGGMLE